MGTIPAVYSALANVDWVGFGAIRVVFLEPLAYNLPLNTLNRALIQLLYVAFCAEDGDSVEQW